MIFLQNGNFLRRMAAPAQQAGYRSHFGWWFGGFSAGAATPPAPDDFGGHFSEEDYKRYRKYLERLSGIKPDIQVTEELQEAIQAVSQLPVAIPTIEAISTTPVIDYQRVETELAAINAYLDRLFFLSVEMQRRRMDDEFALLLLV